MGVLVAALLAGAMPGTFAANVKPGTTCKKIGATQYKSNVVYTCVKVGKKKQWDKGTVIKFEAPKLKWTDVRFVKVTELRPIINDFWTADNYKDANLFKSSCQKLSSFIKGLPSDTPLIENLKNVEFYCVGRGVPEQLAKWVNDYRVMGFAPCGTPLFSAKFFRSYTQVMSSISTWEILEFEYTNSFPERIRLNSVRTNFPSYIDSSWVAISEATAPTLKDEIILFEANQTKIIRWYIDSYKFKEFRDAGRVPEIYEASSQLMDPKYGGGTNCMIVNTKPVSK